MKRIERYTASWCQPCKGLAMLLDDITLDIPLEVVDIDANMEKAVSNGIRTVPTLIMYDENNVEVKRLTGLPQKADLQEWVSN